MVDFRWSDAWILFAAGLASSRSERAGMATLAEVIGAADAVQHAIATREELSGALARLSRARHLAVEGETVRLLPSGQALFAEASRAGRGLDVQQEALGRLLDARRWVPIEDPDTGSEADAAFLPEEAYDEAVRRYHASLKRRR